MVTGVPLACKKRCMVYGELLADFRYDWFWLYVEISGDWIV